MRLLKVLIGGVRLFAGDKLTIDFFATDRVPRIGAEHGIADVAPVGDVGSIFSQNVVGISGVNATGKTTVLNLLRLVLDLLAGEVAMRGFVGQDFVFGKVGDSIIIESIFWHEGSFYYLESHLMKERLVFGSGEPALRQFTFGDETLWRLDSTRVNRRMIADPEVFKESASVIKRRFGGAGDPHALTEEEIGLLGDSRSVVSAVTGRARSSVTSLRRQLPRQTLPAPVVQAFDSSVERLEWDPANEVYTIKFHGEQDRVVDRNVAKALLSRGTVYGVEMVSQAIDVLASGGYLLIDEMEEAINRSLVATVIDLFVSPVTNPNGAQLVFTTHYPELLDVLHRKDNVYLLVRGEDQRTEAIKYSDRVSRIENKKSEVVLSNLIRGTMPRYPDVHAMRAYVREQVNGR